MVFEGISFSPNMQLFSDADKPHFYFADRVNVYKELIEQKIMPGCEAKFCTAMKGQWFNIFLLLALSEPYMICTKKKWKDNLGNMRSHASHFRCLHGDVAVCV